MRRKSLVPTLLILLSSGISIVTGILLDQRSPAGTSNYRAIYYASRTVFRNADPYRPDDFLRVYGEESGEFPSVPTQRQLFLRAVPICVNLPTTLFLIAPLAMLPWNISHLIWLALISIGFTIAGFLAYDLGRDYAPRFSLLLVCLMLANSEVLFAVGNSAGLAVSLCVVALWCFIRQRGEWIGSVLLALSLALKPHDSGLLWLLLLTLDGRLRRRAAWSLVIVCGISVLSVLWVSRAAPRWPQELSANLSATSQRGDISDPGPGSISRSQSADVVISLQSALSVLRDDPAFYNPGALLVSGTLLLVVFVKTTLNRTQFPDAWLAISAVAALSVLPSYHRPYDARLLLLAVPASAMLWSEGGRGQKAVALVAVAASFFTADIPLAIVSLVTRNLNVVGMHMAEKIVLLPIIRPAPLILLLHATLFTAVYVRNKRKDSLVGTLARFGRSVRTELENTEPGRN